MLATKMKHQQTAAFSIKGSHHRIDSENSSGSGRRSGRSGRRVKEEYNARHKCQAKSNTHSNVSYLTSALSLPGTCTIRGYEPGAHAGSLASIDVSL